MTRYRLPEALGGGEWPGTEITEREHGVYVRLTVEAVGYVTLPLAALTELKPPPPKEPPDGSVVLVQIGDHRILWLRKDDSWNAKGDYRWFSIEEGAAFQWAGGVVPPVKHSITPLLAGNLPLADWERELLEGGASS